MVPSGEEYTKDSLVKKNRNKTLCLAVKKKKKLGIRY